MWSSQTKTNLAERAERAPLLSSGESEAKTDNGSLGTAVTSTGICPKYSLRFVIAGVSVMVIGVVVAVVILTMDKNDSETHGVVNSQAEQCSQVGADTLKKGGHAVDAAITTFLCLGVVIPQSSGIGGGGFMVIKNGSSYYALDFRETAPLSATSDMFAENGTLSAYGGLAIAVPGELRGMYMAWKRFGRLQWEELFQPVIDLSRNGFYVTSRFAEVIADELDKKLAYSSKLRNIFAPGGVPVKEGDVLRRPDLADVLQTIATEGVDAFYNGSLTQSIIDAVAEAGGNITAEDLKNYQAYWKEPLMSTYRDQTLYTVPAPSGGPVFLSIVGILEGYNLQPSEKDDPFSYHRTVEAIKFGFAQKTRLGDPDFVPDIDDLTNIMLNKTAAESLRRRINDTRTFPPEYYGPFFPSPDYGTAHACVIDSDHNMVSFTSSINLFFGSGVVTDDGILLNDHMSDFTWPTGSTTANQSQANIIEPGKRPQSSMTPVISHRRMETGEQYTLLGGSGGTRILNDVTQVYLNLFSYDLPLNEAIDRLRLYTRLYPDRVGYEVDFPEDIIRSLEDKGHKMALETTYRSTTVAMVKGNVMSAHADPRMAGSGSVVF